MTVLEVLRAALAKATPGPWRCGPDSRIVLAKSGVWVADIQHSRDRRIILLFRNHADALLAVVEAADAAQAFLDDYDLYEHICKVNLRKALAALDAEVTL